MSLGISDEAGSRPYDDSVNDRYAGSIVPLEVSDDLRRVPAGALRPLRGVGIQRAEMSIRTGV